MRRTTLLCLSSLALFASAIAVLSMNGCGHYFDPSIKIRHVVIIFQENRTPDNLFHDPALIKAGADIASTGLNSLGQRLQLEPIPLNVPYDLSHVHSAFVAMYDGGKMDGADKLPITCDRDSNQCSPSNPQFRYVNPTDVQPYFQLAERYTFGDRMFQTNQGPSFPAHQFIISGTSAPTANSNLFVAENPQGDSTIGCAGSPKEFVSVIGPNGQEDSKMFPCTDHPALTDELNANNISWRYYTPSSGSLWVGPNGIRHICGPNEDPPHATKCVGPDWVKHVILSKPERPAPILNDIANGQLPTVSWVVPSGQNSDHAGLNLGGGPSWVAAIVNAIGASPYWSDTAIIITWDDWGGWYDHVPPPRVINDGKSWGSGYVYGFRVPLIVVSPYAKQAYISHVNHDFGSILNFMERTFRLASLGYADAHADDLADCFDFGQTPLVFQKIDAPLDAAHFLNDTTPPTDPDDD